MWHLLLYTLHRRAGTDAGPLPGLWVGHAPKKALRLRRQETLLLYLVQRGNASFPPDQVDKLLASLAGRYFREDGSTTSALQAAVRALNARLVRHNQRLAAENRHTALWLAMAVWRAQRVLLGLTGPLHGYFVAQQVTHVHNPVLAGSGLGTQQVPRIYFATTEALPNGLLLLSPDPLADQPETLRFPPARRPDPLLRRLLADPRPDLTAVVVQMRPGEGENRIRPVRARWLMTPRASQTPQAVSPALKESLPSEGGNAPSEQTGSHETAPAPSGDAHPEEISPPISEETASSSSPAAPPAQPKAEEAQQKSSAPARAQPHQEGSPQASEREALPVVADPPGATAVPPPSAAGHPGPSPAQPTITASSQATAPMRPAPSPPPRERHWRRRIAAALACAGTIGQHVRWGVGKATRPVAQVLQRALPTAEEWVALPRSMMAFAAVVVPLVVVAFAVTVFLRRGRREQVAYHFGVAQQYYQQALAASDETTRYQTLQAAESELQLALALGKDQEVVALETQVRQRMDALDKVTRVTFEPLINGFPLQGHSILRIERLPEALFALDATTGKVLRFRPVVQGYDYDPNFDCGPGQFPGVTVGPLVDFIVVDPALGKGYPVLGVDAHGNLLYCPLKGASYARALPLHTTLPAGRRLLRLLGDQMYLLDPAQRALDLFSAQEDFSGDPSDVFAGQAPAWLDEVVDFAAQRGVLFFLLRDGQVMRCDQVSPTDPLACQPLTYHDARPGRGDGPTLADTRPVRLDVNVIQEPTLFMLNDQGTGIFVFSFRLAYHHQIRPKSPLAGPISAFLVDTHQDPAGNRWLLVAAGEQIYRAPLR